MLPLQMNDRINSKLTACLLVYNHAHLLEKVIESILIQSYSEFNLIISDDCSTDESYNIAKRFESIDTRVITLITPRNLGMAGNANFAIRQADSEFIALLHHDDLLDEDTFKEWIECIDLNENVAFVANDYRTDLKVSSNDYLNDKLTYINSGKNLLKNILLKQWGSPIRGTAIIRKKFFDQIGGMNEKFGLLADVDLWMRLSSKWDVGYINKPLITVLNARPKKYPKNYTEFTWERIFLLFDIHSSNINKLNFPLLLNYAARRFVFRNKVSFQIIKWHIYAIIRNKKYIIISYPEKCPHEYLYSRIIHSTIKFLYNF